jgi:predicted Zn-dependent peptidase
MKGGARLIVASWTTLSTWGCAAVTYTSSDPAEETGGAITLGAGGGSPARRGQALDRTVAPAVGDPDAMSMPEVQDYTLDNGLRVVLVERHALPLVSLEVQARGGASAHPAGQAGLAAMAADMLDEGTTTRSALEISAAIDVLGASLSSTAGYDASQLRLSVLSNHLEEALGVLADVVLRPTFPERDLERVRRQRLARVLQRSDVPAALAEDAFAGVLYGKGHPYGVPLLGTEQTLSGLTRDDVIDYWRARYVPGQATLVVAGDVTRAQLDSMLATAFAGWSGAGEDPPRLPTPEARTARRIYLVDKPGAAQSEVRVGRVAVERATADYYPLSVLNTVLGGSFTSRLNAKLREEKGYTYGAGSWFDMRRAPGPFEAAAAVATEVTDSAVAEFVREIDRMHAEPVPDPELDRARNYLALRLPQRFESLDDVVRQLSELVLYDVPLDFYEGYVAGVESVGPDAAADVAARHLGTDAMAIVVAGDRSAVEGPLRALGIGDVVVLEAPPTSGGEGRR